MKFFIGAVLVAACAQPVLACDFCAVYSATETRTGKGFFAGVAEQFTYFATAQQGGREVPNPTGQYLDSSITQLLLGYNINNRFGLQFNAPIIYRSFKRPEGFTIDRGTESGIGDVSLVGKYLVYQHQTEDTTVLGNILGGVKFPTGSSSRIKEEL